MNANKTTEVSLPVGENLGWDTTDVIEDDKNSLKSIAESGVLAHSLKQSRQKWVFNTFPKFFAKPRGNKAAEPVPQPPAHRLLNRGRCDVVIGPHIFSDTNFYEVQYLPDQAQVQTGLFMNQPTSIALTTMQAIQPRIIEMQFIERFYPKLVPLFQWVHDPNNHPEVGARIESAMAADTCFNKLVRSVLAGTVTTDELQTLAPLAVQVYPSTVSIPASTSTTLSPYQFPDAAPSVPAVKAFDLVIEFKEAPSERWLVPRGPALLERKNDKDTTLTLCLPFDQVAITDTQPQSDTTIKNKPAGEDTREAVSLLLKDVPPFIAEMLALWIGGQETVDRNRAIINGLGKRKRLYLGYQLPSCPLLTQLQTISQPYTMKLLKHGPNPQRPPRPRKTAPKNATKDPVVAKKAVAVSTTQPMPNVTPQPPPAPAAPPVPKKMKTTHMPSSLEIKCVVCNAKDVPLLLGGRYCRVCIETGKARSHPSFVAALQSRPYSVPTFSPTVPTTTTFSVPLNSPGSSTGPSASNQSTVSRGKQP